MVSYIRARAEGLDVECKVGLMQRPERVVLTSLGAILCGICAEAVENTFSPLWFLFLIEMLAEKTSKCKKLFCFLFAHMCVN